MFSTTRRSLAVASTFIACIAAIGGGNILQDLPPLLSSGASVDDDNSSAPRWSDYGAPRPTYIVHVAEEADVATTVQYCNDHDIQFLAQSGAHGWATTFTLGEDDRDSVIINMRGLNSMSLNGEGNQVTIGGGTIHGEWVEFSYANGVQALNGGCDCVGALGSTLGGGVSRWMNHYGMPVDNVLSLNLVTASGELLTLSRDSASDSPQAPDGEAQDLLWAVLGAGPNFGIVTSATFNTFPLIDSGDLWAGELLFPASSLRGFIETLNALELSRDMNLFWGFSNRGPEVGSVITAQISHMGPSPAERGREAFQSLYDLGPLDDTTEVLPYDRINEDTAALCEPGSRKPGWFTGLRGKYDYHTWQAVWDEWSAVVEAEPELEGTTILVECYSNEVLREIGPRYSSYAHRDIDYYAWILFGYGNEGLDSTAEELGSRVRELWRSTSGFQNETHQSTYLNFAHGDESLEEIYGDSLPRLRELKQQWDPNGRFNQWFPIQ